MAGSDSPPTMSAARNSFGDAILPGGEISAYHASPHTFQEFDPTKLGTGEGETTFGRGLYFAGHPATADAYQRSLRYQHKADIHLYDVKIDVPSDKLLNWDTRVNEQPPHIKEAIENNPKIRAAVDEWAGHHFGDGATLESMGMSRNDLYGENIVHAVEAKYGKDAPAVLKEAGISGMRYLDQGSRGVTGGTATYNYVIYDESKVAITGMNGQPVTHPPSNVEGTGTTSPATAPESGYVPPTAQTQQGSTKPGPTVVTPTSATVQSSGTPTEPVPPSAQGAKAPEPHTLAKPSSEIALPREPSPLRDAGRVLRSGVPGAISSLLHSGANFNDGLRAIDAFRSAHPEVSLSGDATKSYAALYATAKAEQGMTGGLSQGVGLSHFIDWAEENHIPPHLRQSLNPTDLGLARDGKTVLGRIASYDKKTSVAPGLA